MYCILICQLGITAKSFALMGLRVGIWTSAPWPLECSFQFNPVLWVQDSLHLLWAGAKLSSWLQGIKGEVKVITWEVNFITLKKGI